MQRRYVSRPGAYAILPRAGGFILTQQADPGPEVQLPGGGVDPGEHILPALHREILEETGWTITQPRKLTTFRQFTYMPEYKIWAEKVCRIYVAHPVRQVAPPSEAGHTALWLDADSTLEALVSPGARAAVSSYLLRVSGR